MTNDTTYRKLQELLSHPEHQKILLEAFRLLTDIINDSSAVEKEPQNAKESQHASTGDDATESDSDLPLEVEEDLVLLKRKEARELGIDLQGIDWCQSEDVLLEIIQKKIDEFEALPIIEPSQPRPVRRLRSMASFSRTSTSGLSAIIQAAQNTTLEETQAIASKMLEEDD